MATSVSIVLCTAPAADADALAERVVAARLAACVNLLGPVRSRYWWQGEVESADEVLLLIKTERDRVAELRDRIVEWHSYDVPEFLEVEAASGLAAYLDWIRASVRD